VVDQGFVAETIGGQIGAAIGYDDLLQFRKLRAESLELLHLRGACGEDDLCAAMLEDVDDAVGRFVEIDGGR